jgi:UDP-N-acetylmuramate--alanine ligase
MNGAVMKNFVSDTTPFASALVGQGGVFVSEVDESDGTIALYNPEVAVLNNVSLDHKSLDELRSLFSEFLGRAKAAIVNADNGEAAALAGGNATTFSLVDPSADFFSAHITPEPAGVLFDLHEKGGDMLRVRLPVPGRHNVANALAATAAARAMGVPLAKIADALARFEGLRRRLEVVGHANGVTVLDDFAHNPDKIEATLDTLHAFPGRLLVMFQPHGYGPLKHMKDALAETFVSKLAADDVLVMPEPVYFGGTVDRSVGSTELVAAIVAGGRSALALPDRAACGDKLLAMAKPGDRIVIMGARDDTLSVFAEELLTRLGRS